MYSTCTFCHAGLGKNEALEHFPVGRRIAFDQALGRLWVVCPTCRQWNLSPLEARWEAIEEGEKLYRDTRLRVATEQIGLAKLRDGTELIRIGQPLRPEFAAWRYGTRLRARRKQYLMFGAATTALLAFGAAGPAMSFALASGAMIPFQILNFARLRHRGMNVYARGEDESGPFVITRSHAAGARIVHAPSTPEGWALKVLRHRGDLPLGSTTPFATRWDGASTLTGDAALALARAVMPQVNPDGASERRVAEATAMLESVSSMHELFRSRASRTIESDSSSYLAKAPPALRLAMEMAVHEETERRALEGELAALESQWREAEQVAAIADSLTLPERIVARFERLRGG